MQDHSWVFEVLEDLEQYADANGMKNLKRGLEEARFATNIDVGISKILGSSILKFPAVNNR